MKRVICILGFIVLLADAALAERYQPQNIFDGTRKSLTIGLGLGYSFGSTHPAGRQKYSSHGLGGCLMVGHGWDTRNIAALEFSGITFFEGFRNISYPRGYNRDYPDDMSFVGASWYHYLSRSNPSGIIALGLGHCSIEEHHAGIGLRVGAGVELIKHLSIMGFMIVGPSSQTRLGYSLSRLGIFILPLAY